MEETLTARLLASAGVEAVCADRIGWDEADQDWTTPYIVLTLVASPIDYHLKGETGLERSVVQADCYGTTRIEAKTLSDALTEFTRAAQWDGTMSVKVQNRRGMQVSNGPPKVYSRSTDLRVIFKGA